MLKDIFNKKKVAALEAEISVLHSIFKRLSSEIDRLERLMKYSKDEPSYHIDVITRSLSLFNPNAWDMTLYLYVEKNEYPIDLVNMPFNLTRPIDNSLTVKDGVATLTIETDDKNHEFVIEYKTGKYIHMYNRKVTEEAVE